MPVSGAFTLQNETVCLEKPTLRSKKDGDMKKTTQAGKLSINGFIVNRDRPMQQTELNLLKHVIKTSGNFTSL